MYKEIFKLQEKIAALEKRLEELKADQSRGVTLLGECDDLLMKHWRISDGDLTNLTARVMALEIVVKRVIERVADLELFVHPNLAKDIIQIHRIIGGAGKNEDE